MNTSSISSSLCSAATFSTPVVFGTQILYLAANLVTNFSPSVSDQIWFNHASTVVSGASFCNVTVTYTHPGQNDNIHVTSWFPTPGAWNERIQATGGGGLVAGGENFVISRNAMAGAVGADYAAITTDAGLEETGDASSWALASSGSVNLYALQNMGSVSLNFYSTPAKYSHFSGSSQGGRQGLMLAQRYPSLYDGIASSAPALKLNSLVATLYWPQLVMAVAGAHPHPCELDALTAAAILQCDGKEGVVDGLISACDYNPFNSVGSTFICATTSTTMQISQLAATIANATWAGPVTVSGDLIWYGANIGADLSGTVTYQGPAQPSCTTNGTCTGVPNSLGSQWLKLFIAKNPNFDLGNITPQQFGDMIHQGEQQFGSLIDTFDPDLSAFKAAGVDKIIPTKNTEDYYNRVMALDPHVHEFYRIFEAPGIQHCSYGNGGQPTSTTARWVQEGMVDHSCEVRKGDLEGNK
ncbi:feruloyl esterase [Leptodontidium sp. 2 PMI_412]|nr:feruloyl esterase [Leptodontidium sp. 2 PMI_412]